jgi:hypothetical protein
LSYGQQELVFGIEGTLNVPITSAATRTTRSSSSNALFGRKTIYTYDENGNKGEREQWAESANNV